MYGHPSFSAHRDDIRADAAWRRNRRVSLCFAAAIVAAEVIYSALRYAPL